MALCSNEICLYICLHKAIAIICLQSFSTHHADTNDGAKFDVYDSSILDKHRSEVINHLERERW